MTAFWIKIIAIASMTLDHSAYHLLEPSVAYDVLRSFGRLAMPLFCFLIAEGYYHTHSIKAYLKRVIGFALLIEAFFIVLYLATGELYLLSVNIILTLASGLTALVLLKSGKMKYQILGVLLIVLVAFTPFDYGVYGVLLIVGCGLIHGEEKMLLKQFALLVSLNFVFIVAVPYLGIGFLIVFLPMQWFSLLALVPIALYSGKEGKKLQLFFYIYYPVHLAVIIGISYLL